jgi:hypothetical protein
MLSTAALNQIGVIDMQPGQNQWAILFILAARNSRRSLDDMTMLATIASTWTFNALQLALTRRSRRADDGSTNAQDLYFARHPRGDWPSNRVLLICCAAHNK